MSKNIEAALVQLGLEQPALRPHIRPVLASLTKEAGKYPVWNARVSEATTAFFRDVLAALKDLGAQTYQPKFGLDTVKFMLYDGVADYGVTLYLHDNTIKILGTRAAWPAHDPAKTAQNILAFYKKG